MESPLAVLSAAAHYVEQMDQLTLTGTVGSSLAPSGRVLPPVTPPVTLFVPCANGLLVPYVQQPYYYNFAGGGAGLHPVPPNKLALSPHPSSTLSSPHGSLGSAVSSRVSTPTEERHILLPRIPNEEQLHQKLLSQVQTPPPPSNRENDQSPFNSTTAYPPKVVLRRKKAQNNDIHEKVENHFRRSLGSNYKDAQIIHSTTNHPTTVHKQQQQQQPTEVMKRVKPNIRRRPHSVFVSEEVDRHFERSLGVEAWQVIQAKRAKLARKTWN